LSSDPEEISTTSFGWPSELVLFSTKFSLFSSLSPLVNRLEVESETSAWAGNSLPFVSAQFTFEKELVQSLPEDSTGLKSSGPVFSVLAADKIVS
jgi:hypothetical protein